MKKLLGAILGLLLLAGCGAPASTTTGAAPPASEPAASTPAATEETPAETPAEEPSEEPAEPPAAIENGDHIVGTDIQPGVYRAEVDPGILELCTVSQSKANGTVMDVRNANEGSVIFTVVEKKDSVVSFSGCGLIALAKDVLRADTTEVTNGYWLVGSELKPGKYQGTVDADSLIKLGTITQFKANGGVMGIRNANSGKVVFTVKQAKGSVVSFSGFSKIKKVG